MDPAHRSLYFLKIFPINAEVLLYEIEALMTCVISHIDVKKKL
jgi:hypothetical protein